MQRLFMFLFAVLLLAPLSAARAIDRYIAVMSGPFLDPPNASRGGGVVHFIDQKDIHRLDFVVYFGLTSPLTGGSLHCCTAVQLAGSVTPAIILPHFPELPSISAGATPFRLDMDDPGLYTPDFLAAAGGTAQLAADRLLTGFYNGHAYISLSSQDYPQGEVRGFITPIPEPSMAAMLLAGLASFGLWRRPRRARVAVGAGLLACAGFASAAATTYEGIMSGPGQHHPNMSPGLGLVRVDVVPERLRVVALNFLYLSGPATGAGLHCCTASPLSGIAPLALDFPDFPRAVGADYRGHLFDLYSPSSYTPDFLALSGGRADLAAGVLLDGLASNRAYVNLRSDVYPGGELRGFLVLGPVPEPAAWQLLLSGLGLIGARRLILGVRVPTRSALRR